LSASSVRPSRMNASSFVFAKRFDLAVRQLPHGT